VCSDPLATQTNASLHTAHNERMTRCTKKILRTLAGLPREMVMDCETRKDRIVRAVTPFRTVATISKSQSQSTNLLPIFSMCQQAFPVPIMSNPICWHFPCHVQMRFTSMIRAKHTRNSQDPFPSFSPLALVPVVEIPVPAIIHA